MKNKDWSKELEVARLAGQAASHVLNTLFGKVNHIRKKGAIDLVTEADVLSEKKIIEVISNHFPEDGILTEESEGSEGTSKRVWIIDPLDGTTNFAHSFPFFATSIALEVEGKMVLGVVEVPYLKEHFEAVMGLGAFLNSKPIRVSETRDMQDSLLATGFPYYVHERPERVLEFFGTMVALAQGIRRPGSAAIDLCYVACGRADGFWEEGLKPWDTAAGMLIVQEAGGMVTDYAGNPYSPNLDTILAANPPIHEAMLKAVADMI